MSSPLASPRSSTSSTDIYTSEPPLTPMSDLGLEKAAERLVLADTEAEEDGLETIPETTGVGGQGGKTSGKDTGLAVPVKQAYRTRPDARSEAQSQFAGFSFGRPPSLEAPITTSEIPIPPPRSPRADQDPCPSTSFSFGSCPSVPLLSTPTAELGAFEYPEHEPGHPLHPSSALESAHMRGSTSSSSSTSSASSSYSRASTSSAHRGSIPLGLALGQSHRRNSIISRPALHPSSSSSSSTHTATGYPSPPQTRRSSTTSTITTLPAAGRRPSIIHSATTEAALPLPSISSIYPGPPDADAPHPPSPYANTARRSSILFHPKHLHQPVPPSLLARRGSLPAASLVSSGLGFSPHRASNTRSSVSIPVGGYGGPGQVTAHRLYNRRESVLSVGSSTGSGSTVRMEGGEITRRSSLRENGRRGGNGQAEASGDGQAVSSADGRGTGSSGGLARRSSMPIHHALSTSTRQEEADRTTQHPPPTQTHAPYSPASPRSGSSARILQPASYGSPVRRSRGSIPNVPASPADLAYDPPAVGSRWTPRPSLTGRSLSSSDESDESGEGAAVERDTPAGGEGTVFSDPWASGQGVLSRMEDEEAEREESRRRGSRLVDIGRPGLETVNSDHTERG